VGDVLDPRAVPLLRAIDLIETDPDSPLAGLVKVSPAPWSYADPSAAFDLPRADLAYGELVRHVRTGRLRIALVLTLLLLLAGVVLNLLLSATPALPVGILLAAAALDVLALLLIQARTRRSPHS
jgi:hypothetical protein